MLANPENVEPRLIGQLNVLKQLLHQLNGL
jgi:hypothetical protein